MFKILESSISELSDTVVVKRGYWGLKKKVKNKEKSSFTSLVTLAPRPGPSNDLRLSAAVLGGAEGHFHRLEGPQDSSHPRPDHAGPPWPTRQQGYSLTLNAPFLQIVLLFITHLSLNFTLSGQEKNAVLWGVKMPSEQTEQDFWVGCCSRKSWLSSPTTPSLGLPVCHWLIDLVGVWACLLASYSYDVLRAWG